MPLMSLARRKSQLDLLAQACARRQSVRVVARGHAPAAPETSTRFLTLHRDGVVLEWPAQGSDLIPVSGAPVEVLFEHRARPFGFRTETRGRMWWSSGDARQVAAWKLALPLCVESRPPRRHYRLSLVSLPAFSARCARVSCPERTFAAQLRNLSAGGLRATAALGASAQITPGELLWVAFTLPGGPDKLEFVVRVAHARRCPRRELTVFGASFCPSEDPFEHWEKLGRIEQFVAGPARGGVCRTGPEPVGGTH